MNWFSGYNCFPVLYSDRKCFDNVIKITLNVFKKMIEIDNKKRKRNDKPKI